MRPHLKAALFGAIVIVVVGASTSYALSEFRAGHARDSRAPDVATSTTLSAVQSVPHLVFRHTGLDSEYGVVAEVALSDPSGPRAFAGVSCDRVDARPGTETCLTTHRGVVTTYKAVDLDADWHQTGSVGLPGIPSRTRLSPDGTLAASTVFVNGDSYLTTGFSTRTIVRHVGGSGYGSLEDFTLVIDGKQVEPTDRNVWGVTFARDDRTFYATVATGGVTYLVRGDLAAKTLTSVATHVECPSLSPDGTRIAFKQAVSDPARGTWWTPAVLDLATGHRTVLAGETRNVDDQIAWLDDRTLLYGLARQGQPGVTDVWSLRASAAAAPQLFVPEAWSPAVVR